MKSGDILALNRIFEVYSSKLLIFAENNLPETQALVGKATKYAAKVMLADACLKLDKHPEARDNRLEGE